MPEKLTKKEQAEKDAARAIVRAEGVESAATVDADENPHPPGTARHGAWIRMKERARRDAAFAKANPPTAPEPGSPENPYPPGTGAHGAWERMQVRKKADAAFAAKHAK